MKIQFSFLIFIFFFVHQLSAALSHQIPCHNRTGCWDCLTSSSDCFWSQCAKVYDHSPGYFWFTHEYTQDLHGKCLNYSRPEDSLPECAVAPNSSSFSIQRFNFSQPTQCQHRPYDRDYSSYGSFSLIFLFSLIVILSLFYYFIYQDSVDFVRSHMSAGLTSEPCEPVALSSLPPEPLTLQPPAADIPSPCSACWRPTRDKIFCSQCSQQIAMVVSPLLVLLTSIFIQLYFLVSLISLSDATIAYVADIEFWVTIGNVAFIIVTSIVITVVLLHTSQYETIQPAISDSSHLLPSDEHHQEEVRRGIYLEQNVHLILRPDEEYYLLQRSHQPAPKWYSFAALDFSAIAALIPLPIFSLLIACLWLYVFIDLDAAIMPDFTRLSVASFILLPLAILFYLGLLLPFALFFGNLHCKFLVVTNQRTILVYHILSSNSYKMRSLQHKHLVQIIPVCATPSTRSFWALALDFIFFSPFTCSEPVDSQFLTTPVEELPSHQLLEFRMKRVNDDFPIPFVVSGEFPDLAQSIISIAHLLGLTPFDWDGLSKTRGLPKISPKYFFSWMFWVVLFILLLTMRVNGAYVPGRWPGLVVPVMLFLGIPIFIFLPIVSSLCLIFVWFVGVGIADGASSIFYLFTTPFFLFGIFALALMPLSSLALQKKQFALPFLKKRSENDEAIQEFPISDASDHESSSEHFSFEERDEMTEKLNNF